MYHPGVDLNTGAGNTDLNDQVYACDFGRVFFIFEGTTGYGKQIIIEHNGYFSRYAHLNGILVKVGDEVTPMTQIGLMGKTGTTSVHLHWEMITVELIAYAKKVKTDWWNFYPEGYSRKWVEAMYMNPLAQVTPHILVKGDSSPKVYALDMNKVATHIPDPEAFQQGFLDKQWGNWDTITVLPQQEIDALCLTI